VRIVKPEPRIWPAVGDVVWDRIRSEFGLMTQDEFEAQFETLFNDPEPFLRQAVRVFTGDDTLFPGFQIIDGILSPAVVALFDKALELQVPHNVFAAWMVTPLPGKNYPRPVDALEYEPQLLEAMDAFVHGRTWVAGASSRRAAPPARR
jgi:hypothetical protein